MKIVNGQYSEAVVYTDVVEEAALDQIRQLCNQAFTQGLQIRIMPDVHAGKGCTIGTTMTIRDKIVPNLVGVDIGCGMLTVCLGKDEIDPEQLDEVINRKIPSGMTVRTTPHALCREIDLTGLRCFKQIQHEYARMSLGTLGGGNHFIEADIDDDGSIYLVVHTGSRHLGLEVANYYQKAGYNELIEEPVDMPALIEKMKAEGRKSEIPGMIRKMKAKAKRDITPDLAYVEGKLFDDYIHDMKLVQKFARLNRKAIMDELIGALKLQEKDRFETIHNYIDTDSMILRKGAVSAMSGERILIPINMRDGSLICIGKGNPEWNYSAPHGAGRLFSRKAARSRFNVDEFRNEMKGIYTTSVREDTLDEAPMCYKDMKDILGNIGPTADVEAVIRPIYNFKAGA